MIVVVLIIYIVIPCNRASRLSFILNDCDDRNDPDDHMGITLNYPTPYDSNKNIPNLHIWQYKTLCSSVFHFYTFSYVSAEVQKCTQWQKW